jgi:hypothetical protein
MTLNGQSIGVGPGEVLFYSELSIAFDNSLAAIARILAVITAGILGSNYFREIGALIKAAGGGPPV